MADEGKVEYEPSQTKRFEISKDPYSRERLRATVDTIKELRVRYPFVVGATLFGSLSKGKSLDTQSAEKSDIDVVIFVDDNKAKENFEKLEEENDEVFADILEADHEIFGKRPSGDYRTPDRRKLEIVTGFISQTAEEKIKSIIPTHSFPKDHLGIGINVSAIDTVGEFSMFETFNRAFLSFQRPDQTVVERLKEVIKSLQTNENSILDISAVALPWLLDIGGGLSKYRKAYLRQLQILDREERDLRWGATIAAVRFYERKNVIPERIQRQYPATYEEATRYFGTQRIMKPSSFNETGK